MLLAVFSALCAAVFPVQLYLCLRCKKAVIKMIPLFFVLVWVIGCAATAGLHLAQEDGRLAAVIGCFIGFYVLVADGLAWLIWVIVKLVQKRRK